MFSNFTETGTAVYVPPFHASIHPVHILISIVMSLRPLWIVVTVYLSGSGNCLFVRAECHSCVRAALHPQEV